MDLIKSLNDWSFFAIIFIGIFLVLGIAELVRRIMMKPPESTRKFVHIFVGLIVSICPLLFKSNLQLITLSSLFIIINGFLIKSNKIASMHVTTRKSYGTVYFPFSVLILSYFWWDKPISFILAILVMTIFRSYRRHRWEKGSNRLYAMAGSKNTSRFLSYVWFYHDYYHAGN